MTHMGHINDTYAYMCILMLRIHMNTHTHDERERERERERDFMRDTHMCMCERMLTCVFSASVVICQLRHSCKYFDVRKK